LKELIFQFPKETISLTSFRQAVQEKSSAYTMVYLKVY